MNYDILLKILPRIMSDFIIALPMAIGWYTSMVLLMVKWIKLQH